MLRKAASERDLYRMCTKTFTWRLLTGPELTEVYLNEMRRDFPAGELKPLSMILTSEAEAPPTHGACLTATRWRLIF